MRLKFINRLIDNERFPPKKLAIGLSLGALIALSLVYWDHSLSLFFAENSTRSIRVSCRFISFLIAPLVHLIIWPLSFALLSFKGKKIHKKSLRLALHLFALNAFVTLFKVLLGRPRPKYLYSEGIFNWQFINFNENFHSFPSRHSATIMIVALFFAMRFPKKKFYLIGGAFILALARIPINSHFLSDIMGGCLTALLSYFVTEYVLNTLRTYADNQSPIPLSNTEADSKPLVAQSDDRAAD